MLVHVFWKGKQRERERELAWAKYFHKREESVGRKNGKKNSSIYSSLGLLESEC
jgi:hypothetical protein